MKEVTDQLTLPKNPLGNPKFFIAASIGDLERTRQEQARNLAQNPFSVRPLIFDQPSFPVPWEQTMVSFIPRVEHHPSQDLSPAPSMLEKAQITASAMKIKDATGELVGRGISLAKQFYYPFESSLYTKLMLGSMAVLDNQRWEQYRQTDWYGNVALLSVFSRRLSDLERVHDNHFFLDVFFTSPENFVQNLQQHARS